MKISGFVLATPGALLAHAAMAQDSAALEKAAKASDYLAQRTSRTGSVVQSRYLAD